MILEGLHKRVTEKVRGKDVVHIKKPKRPSKRIEVLSPLEKKLISQYEKPFDDYKETVKALGKEVKIGDIKSVRERLRAIIQAMWLVVEKFSAPLTKRRTALCNHLSEAERKKLNFNKAYIDKLRSSNFAPCVYGDHANLFTLSPVPILAKCDPKYIIEANKVSFRVGYIFLEQTMTPDIKELMQDYGRIVNFKVTDSILDDDKPRRPRHKRPDYSVYTKSKEADPEITQEGDYQDQNDIDD
jgi:hypothetical protein